MLNLPVLWQKRLALWTILGLAVVGNILYFKRTRVISVTEEQAKIGRILLNGEHYKLLWNTSSGHWEMKQPTQRKQHIGHTWIRSRQELLREGRPVKLFLVSYLRGGSSIAGELFNCDPSASVWYDSGNVFFTSYHGRSLGPKSEDLYLKNGIRRPLGRAELESMTDFYNNIFSCNYEDLPPEALSREFIEKSSAMASYVSCLEGSNKMSNISECLQHISSLCNHPVVEDSLANCPFFIDVTRSVMNENRGILNEVFLLRAMNAHLKKAFTQHGYHEDQNRLRMFVRHGICIERINRNNLQCLNHAIIRCEHSAVRAIQVLHMKMEDLKPIIQENPDLHVIHYTRDPRGIASSRMSSSMQRRGSWTAVREADMICQRIREDLKQRHRLEVMFPGVFTQLTYENLVTRPNATAEQFYSIFNGKPHKTWSTFAKVHMNAEKDGGHFDTTVHNATATTRKWRKNIPIQKQKMIKQLCADVIQELGYEL